MSRIDMDDWTPIIPGILKSWVPRDVSTPLVSTPVPFDLEREIKAAQERLHRSIGQRARRHREALARLVGRHRFLMSERGELAIKLFASMNGGARGW